MCAAERECILQLGQCATDLRVCPLCAAAKRCLSSGIAGIGVGGVFLVVVHADG